MSALSISKKDLSLFKKGIYPQYEENCNYQKFAHYYDYILRETHYQSWTQYLLDMIHVYKPGSKIVLDLACGTGNMSIPLSIFGYDVYGLDISKEMLNIALEKSNSEGVSIEYIHGAMWEINYKEYFDIIFSFHNSINYIVDKITLTKVFLGVSQALNSKGLFIFDITTEKNILKNFLNKTRFEKTKKFSYRWANDYNKNLRLIYSTLDFLDHNSGNAFRETHTQKVYLLEEIEKLAHLYFSEVFVFQSFSFDPPKKVSDAYHLVCIK